MDFRHISAPPRSSLPRQSCRLPFPHQGRRNTWERHTTCKRRSGRESSERPPWRRRVRRPILCCTSRRDGRWLASGMTAGRSGSCRGASCWLEGRCMLPSAPGRPAARSSSLAAVVVVMFPGRHGSIVRAWLVAPGWFSAGWRPREDASCRAHWRERGLSGR